MVRRRALQLSQRCWGHVGLFAALLPVALPAGAGARTWYVKPDGTGDTPTIQAAVDSATAGDVVLLARGIYTWTSQNSTGQRMVRIVEKEIVLRGEGGPETTILDAQRRGGVLEAWDVDNIRVEGLTIANGSHLNVWGGAGLGFFSHSNATVSNCIVENNSAPYGGGIYCDLGTQANISNSIIRSNSASVGLGVAQGGGIFCDQATITNCQVLGNFVDEGRGGGIYGGEGTFVSGCTIRGNSATSRYGQMGGGGGGIAGGGTISDCWFEGNGAANEGGSLGEMNTLGGGILGARTVTRCVFVRNTAWSRPTEYETGYGYGAAICGADMITGCIFIANSAQNSGTVVGCRIMSGCTFIGNLGGIGNCTSVSNCIIASTRGLVYQHVTVGCSNLFENSGESFNYVDNGGNFSADPEFCGSDPVTSLNVTLQADSPCAPGKHPEGLSCELIGAAPVGCAAVSIEATTWSRLKSLYR